jgi:hypothetical protein
MIFRDAERPVRVAHGCPLPCGLFVFENVNDVHKEEFMQYALLVYERPGSYDRLSPDELAAITAEYLAIAGEDGVVGGAQLQPVTTATTVRLLDGQSVMTDGPFAETKEVFGGYYLVEADDLDVALAIAERIPSARLGGSVEVRPMVEMPG